MQLYSFYHNIHNKASDVNLLSDYKRKDSTAVEPFFGYKYELNLLAACNSLIYKLVELLRLLGGGIAVQARHAHRLTLINSALNKIRQMYICKQCCRRLNPTTETAKLL